MCERYLAIQKNAKSDRNIVAVRRRQDHYLGMSSPSQPSQASGKPRRLVGALAAGAGILASRVAGLVRERVFAHYLGRSPAADAFRAALRIPNLLQNLLGEGVLSAAFIPVYTRLITEGKRDEAAVVARTIATLLALVASIIAVLGVVAAEPLVTVLAAGFTGPTKDLTVQLVQILFPGVAVLVLSAWCLGVLNSHRKFFLSYAAPVIWNIALIAAAINAGRRFVHGDGSSLVVWVAWGFVIGSLLQFVVQLPSVMALVKQLRPQLATDNPHVRNAVRAFGPVLLGRGSVQISAYVDQVLASYLGIGIVSAMSFANILYLLPISLFGMAISAAELPAMSAATVNSGSIASALQTRLEVSLRRVVFFVIPSAVAFVAIGHVLVGVLFQSGRFGASDTQAVWIILCGSAIGLSAGTQGRLLASAFYALSDTRTPLRAALVRLFLTFVFGYLVVFPVRHWLGYSEVWGAFGLSATAGVAAWVEFELLRRWLTRRIGPVPVPVRLSLLLTALAGVAGGAGYGVDHLLPTQTHIGLRAALVVPVFGGVYLLLTILCKIPESTQLLAKIQKRR
jgi:putative peptidoglycan lipid II flippase